MLVRKLLTLTVLALSITAIAACGGGSKSGGGSTADFCSTLKADVATFEKLGNEQNLNNDQLIAVMSDLTNKAPSEIKADMQTVLDGVKKFVELSSQLSADPSKASSLNSSLEGESKKFETATTNVETFAKTKCGIDLNSDSTSSSTSSDSEESTDSTDESTDSTDSTDESTDSEDSST